MTLINPLEMSAEDNEIVCENSMPSMRSHADFFVVMPTGGVTPAPFRFVDCAWAKAREIVARENAKRFA